MKNNAFSSPQRQTKIGIVLLTLKNIGKLLRAIWPIILIAYFRDANPREWIIYTLIAGLTLYLTIYTILDYWNFSYFIDTKNEKFVIKKGIINKKEIGIEKSKIQEVNINQPFIHRLLGVYELEIDSPGSDKKEVKVNAISIQNALDIKNYLLNNLPERVPMNDESFFYEEDNPETTLKISLSSLFKYGITSNYLRSFAAIIGFFFYIRQQISDVLKDFKLEDYILQQSDLEENIQKSVVENFSFLYAFIFVFAILLVGILVSLVLTLFKYYGMKVRKKKSNFL